MQNTETKLEKLYVHLPNWVDMDAPATNRNSEKSTQDGFATIQVQVLDEGEDVKYGLWNGALFKFKDVKFSRPYGPHWRVEYMTESDLAN